MKYIVCTKIHLWIFAVAGALFLAFPGCDLGERPSNDLLLDASADQKNFSYSVSQSFSLDLDLNADAGYQWFITLSDTAVVRLERTAYRPKGGNPNICGGMTVETFSFRAAGPGTCRISMAERQGWMPNDPPLHRMEFTVTVIR